MPWGAEIETASYDQSTAILSLAGKVFGGVVYGVSRIYVINTGTLVSYEGVIQSWADEAASALFTPALPPGTYDAYMVTSNDEEISLANAIALTSVGRRSLNLGLAVCAA
jgi:hypothetical protein